jgi:hypothetical protein
MLLNVYGRYDEARQMPLETAGTTIVIHKGSQGNMMGYAGVQARVQAQASQKRRGLLLRRT